MPGITEFLDCINKTLPDNTKVFNTNGIPLNDEICEMLNEGKNVPSMKAALTKCPV